MAEKKAVDYIQKYETLKGVRNQWQSLWDDISLYVCPAKDVKSIERKVYDSTALWAREQLASGLQGLILNEAVPWFELEASVVTNEELDIGKKEAVKLWQQQTRDILIKAFNHAGANFYHQMHEFFLTLVAYGTAIFYIEENPSSPYFVFFKNIPLEECFIEDNERGFVDTMYRKFKMTGKVAAEKFTEEKKYKEALLKGAEEDIEILHAVTPAFGVKDGSYTSVYIDLGSQKIIKTGRYNIFPFFVTRWNKDITTPYGFSPASYIMQNIKLLNQLCKIWVDYILKRTNPTLLVPKTGYFLPLNTAPGAINFYINEMAAPIKPLYELEDIAPSMQEQNNCREIIAKAFCLDLFHIQTNKEMTATEVQARNDERMKMLSPVVGRLEAELLNPLILAIYKIYQNYNVLPQLQIDIELNIEYISPLIRAQKAGSYRVVERLIMFLQQAGIGNIYPQVFDKIDFDKAVDLFCDLNGVQPSILRTTDEIETIRAQRQQQLQQQQQQLG